MVLMWVVVGPSVIVTGGGVSVAPARSAVHGLELLTGPEGLVVVERRTALTLHKSENRDTQTSLLIHTLNSRTPVRPKTKGTDARTRTAGKFAVII